MSSTTNKSFKINTLQNKIFVFFIFLLLLVQLLSFFTTYQANEKTESNQLNNHLLTSKQVFDTQFNSRNYYLSAFAETAAKDYALKSAFQDDTKSFLTALNNHRKRIDANIAIAISPEGKIIGQLVTYYQSNNDNTDKLKVKIGAEQGQKFKHLQWFQQANVAQIYRIGENIYQLSLSPLKSGSRITGWIGFGYVLDSQLANELALLTHVNIGFVLLNEKQPLLLAKSTYEESEQGIQINNEQLNPQLIRTLLNNESTRYISDKIELGAVDNSVLIALMYKSKVDLLKNIQADWWQVLIFFVVSLLLSLLGAYIISVGITRPIKQLILQIKSVANGNYDQKISIKNSHELMELANEFNQMTTAVVSREKLISHSAYHDPLTNLPNRNSLLNALKKKDFVNEKYMILQIDIRRIKEFNDTLGHKVGDEIIIDVAKRLSACKFSKEVSHLGGDEFILVVKNTPLEPLMLELMQQLDPIYVHKNISLHLQYSVGIALCPEHVSDKVVDLLQKTDVALQYAKNQKQLYQIYDPQFDFNTVERLHLINSLKTAIEKNHLVLFYQPKMSIQTNKISHVEALIRWQHPVNGLIAPDEFISLAEQTGQMDALTRWVTTEALNQYLRWQEMNINMNIAINISAENLKDKDYSDFIIALKQKHNIKDLAITLEVTEDAVLADPKQATKVLNYLKDHGFKLSIDDYGTGYSSLAQLKQLPVQELKIDKSFVQQLMQENDDQIIVRSTIELAHNMGLTVVAEGIEDERTLLWLKDHKCEFAQGYFISRPIPPNMFEKWLTTCPYHYDKCVDDIEET